MANSFNLYKVDFVEEDVGRKVKQSKKRVTWTFQLDIARTVASEPEAEQAPFLSDVASPPSTALVTTETKTQTLAYSVSLIWSLKSGKQQVEMNDGEEQVWFDRKPGASVCSHAWTTRDGLLQLEVLATGRAPKRHVAPDFRCYDLMINGRAFDDLPSLNEDRSFSREPVPVSSVDLPRSIVEILYPTGYRWNDPSTGEKDMNATNGQDVEYEEYQSHIQVAEQ
jgi:hypothetical protein